MSNTITDMLMVGTLVFFFVTIAWCAHDLADTTAQHQEEYGLGSVVTTTAGYEALTNDSFTGVVVGGDCVWDPSLTIRNRDGDERTIAIDFLEPV